MVRCLRLTLRVLLFTFQYLYTYQQKQCFNSQFNIFQHLLMLSSPWTFWVQMMRPKGWVLVCQSVGFVKLPSYTPLGTSLRLSGVLEECRPPQSHDYTLSPIRYSLGMSRDWGTVSLAHRLLRTRNLQMIKIKDEHCESPPSRTLNNACWKG